MAVNTISSPADIANIALAKIGYKKSVGNLFDGSLAAQKILNVYQNTRDALLRDGEWPFSERNVAATLLKSAPVGGYIPPTVWNGATNPALNWLFSYGWPDDCLKVRYLKATPLFVPNFDPQPNLFSVANDNYYTPARRVILSNVAGVNIVYTGQITDVTTMPPDFIEEFADALGENIAAVLTTMDAQKLAAAAEGADEMRAGAEQG